MGEIVAIGRYPVKSLLGEALTQARLGADGLDGDRRYALVDDATGLVASAKNPRRWGHLLRHAARYDGDRLVITPPLDLTGVSLAEREAGDALIERLTPQTEPGAGAMTRSVLRAPTFVDYAAVHLVSTATLDALGADARRFRPNLVVHIEGAEPFAENDWAGHTVALGDRAEIDVMHATPRCVVPALAHGDLPPDPALLRAAARRNRVRLFDLGRLTCVGAYAAVRTPGPLRVGDRVHIRGRDVVRTA